MKLVLLFLMLNIMLLSDEEYENEVYTYINTNKVNVEYAVYITTEKYARIFANSGDELLESRGADLWDVSNRLINILNKKSEHIDLASEPNNPEKISEPETLEETSPLDTPAIIVADDLAPSEIAQMDKTKLLALVLRQGSIHSHTAILARILGIPAIFGADIDEGSDGECGIVNGDECCDGRYGIVDGYEGVFYIEPEQDIIDACLSKRQAADGEREALLSLKGKDNITKSGKRISICANVGSLSDLDAVLYNDADGIGLLRTEFLYFESKADFSEDEQYETYKKVVEKMGGRKVVIRTFDIRLDKKIDGKPDIKPDNTDIDLTDTQGLYIARPDVFKIQLRAIYRASAHGKISILYPMITSLNDVFEIKKISDEVREELKSEGVATSDVEEGIMIETPSAVEESGELAKYVDFFSIGTNDLIHYALGIDRHGLGNDKLGKAGYVDILKLIKDICDNAHKAGIKVSICGELGADTLLTERLIESGIDELSVYPDAVLTVRKAVREIS